MEVPSERYGSSPSRLGLLLRLRVAAERTAVDVSLLQVVRLREELAVVGQRLREVLAATTRQPPC